MFWGRSVNKDGCPCIWCAGIFSTSLLNLAKFDRKKSISKTLSTKSAFWGPFHQQVKMEEIWHKPLNAQKNPTRSPKGNKSYTWVQCANFFRNRRPGRLFLFTDRPEKYKLGRGRWDLASCQVSFNSIQRFQRRSKKCLSESEASAAIFFFRSARKTQTWSRTLRSFIIASCQVWLNSILLFHRRSRSCLNQSEARVAIFFSDRPEKHKLGRGRWDLASCQVWLNSILRFQRRSRKCLSQSEARAALLFFRSARKTQTW